MTEHTTPSRRPFNTEGLVLVAITAVIGVMAGAASFTHMHDWTMANSPAGTPQWFGWANAVVSELTPTASVLVMRRRRHLGQPVVFPVLVLLASVALSLSAQFAQATPSVSGWLLAAVPALGFLAMTKLALGHTAGDRHDLVDEDQVVETVESPRAVPDTAPVTPEPDHTEQPVDDRPVFVPWVPAAVPAHSNGTHPEVTND